MHYYQFHIGDYATHTRHLTLLEDLAYRRMLDLYYLHEQPFNEDATVVARLLNMRGNEVEVAAVLNEFFVLTDRGWINERVEREINGFKGKAEAASRAGKASAERRRNDRSTTVQPTINQEPITKNQEPVLKAIALKRSKQLPEDHQPTQEHFNLALSLGIDLKAELPKFRDYHQAKGTTMKDWDAALRTWIRNAAKFAADKPKAKLGYIHDLSTMDYTKGVDEDGRF